MGYSKTVLDFKDSLQGPLALAMASKVTGLGL